jgi:hypothetical protein
MIKLSKQRSPGRQKSMCFEATGWLQGRASKLLRTRRKVPATYSNAPSVTWAFMLNVLIHRLVQHYSLTLSLRIHIKVKQKSSTDQWFYR